jgi:hypothetical protein
MRFLQKNSLTKITGAFILFAIVFTIVSQEQWNKDNGVIAADARGYYAYLPALFIHNDLKFENYEDYKIDKRYEVWVMEDESGTKYIKFTCGMSIMYSPFFLISHGLAESLGEEANGFSYPYKIGLVVSSIFYLFIALLFLSKLLLRYFEDRVVSICLLILFLATNLYVFETEFMTQSHGYSFALLTVFMYSCVKWLDAPKIKWAIWMGITGGLMFLIRPIDIIFLTFILLFNIKSLKDLTERFKLIWTYKLQALLFLGLFLLMIAPQLLYYKHIFGSFIYYSYTKEGFFFLSPHLFDTVFSYRNGWLVYSPVMILSLIGFFFVKRYSKEFSWFSPLAFLIYFYLISAWWCWWYAGFGNRAFINLYPILAIPLCAFISFALSKKLFVRVGLNVLVLSFIVLNVFQSYQFKQRIIHWGSMTKDAYWDAFGRTKNSQLQVLYLRQPDLLEAQKGKNIVSVPVVKTLSSFKNSFEHVKPSDSSYYPYLQDNQGYSSNKALHFKKGIPFMMKTEVTVPKNTTHVFITCKIKRTGEVIAVLDGKEKMPYYFVSEDIVNFDKGWEELKLFAPFPNMNKSQLLYFYLANKSMAEIDIDDLEVKFLSLSYKKVEQ